jgi:hypothetical protein
LVILVLVIITTPWFGYLYEMIIGRPITSWFWGPSNPRNIEGFFMSFFFFVTLLISIFGSEKKYRKIIVILGALLFINIVLGAWESLIINIIAALSAWIIAQGILILKKIFNL